MKPLAERMQQIRQEDRAAAQKEADAASARAKGDKTLKAIAAEAEALAQLSDEIRTAAALDLPVHLDLPPKLPDYLPKVNLDAATERAEMLDDLVASEQYGRPADELFAVRAADVGACEECIEGYIELGLDRESDEAAEAADHVLEIERHSIADMTCATAALVGRTVEFDADGRPLQAQTVEEMEAEFKQGRRQVEGMVIKAMILKSQTQAVAAVAETPPQTESLPAVVEVSPVQSEPVEPVAVVPPVQSEVEMATVPAEVSPVQSEPVVVPPVQPEVEMEAPANASTEAAVGEDCESNLDLSDLGMESSESEAVSEAEGSEACEKEAEDVPALPEKSAAKAKAAPKPKGAKAAAKAAAKKKGTPKPKPKPKGKSKAAAKKAAENGSKRSRKEKALAASAKGSRSISASLGGPAPSNKRRK